ncbi:MAG: sulfur carrier protein ThiS [Bryobacterales bacterium]|nr:sulfur carrier protein ThiS [Bryobacterales bacterium]
MEITLNGEKHAAPDGCTVLGLLESLQIAPDRVAVELNGAIVRKPAWPETVVTPGSTVEVVMFVGGGTARAATTVPTGTHRPKR